MNDCDTPVKKEGGHLRKKHKIIMEKRRRSRINTCLSQLKCILLQSMKKENSEFSKLEKADILEMTVKYLRNVQRQQFSIAMATDPSALNKYVAGFNECATEAMHYLDQSSTGSDEVKSRLSDHLARCTQVTVLQQPAAPVPPVAVQSAPVPGLVLPQQVFVQVPVFHTNVKSSPSNTNVVNNTVSSGRCISPVGATAPASSGNCFRTPSVSPVSSTSVPTSPVTNSSRRSEEASLGFCGIKTPAMKKEHSWSHSFNPDSDSCHKVPSAVMPEHSLRKCFDNANVFTVSNVHYDASEKMWRPW